MCRGEQLVDGGLRTQAIQQRSSGTDAGLYLADQRPEPRSVFRGATLERSVGQVEQLFGPVSEALASDVALEPFATGHCEAVHSIALRGEAIGELGARVVTEHPRLPYEAFFDAVPRSHLEFFERLELSFRGPDVLCVHGGLDPSGGLVENQRADDLIWGTESFPDEYDRDESVVYGHWNNAVVDGGRPRPRIVNNTYGIDTIAYGVLTAVRFPDERVFQSDRPR